MVGSGPTIPKRYLQELIGNSEKTEICTETDQIPSSNCELTLSFSFPCLFQSQTIEFDEGAGAVLRIQPLRTPRDENVYECVAQNSVAEITVNAKLTVLRGKFCN